MEHALRKNAESIHDQLAAFAAELEMRLQKAVPTFPKLSSIQGEVLIFRNGDWNKASSLELEVRPSVGVLSVKFINTHPDLRRNPDDRTGSSVVGAIESLAREKGYRRIYAHRVLPESGGFWEKLDFRMVPEMTGVNPHYVKNLS